MLDNTGSSVYLCQLRMRINPHLLQQYEDYKKILFRVTKKKEQKGATVKEEKEPEGARAAAVCGRIRVNREGGMLRRKEALMDKRD